MTGELDELRERFPDWVIDAQWVTVASGPDKRLYAASRGDVTLATWSAAQLAADIRLAEARGDE